MSFCSNVSDGDNLNEMSTFFLGGVGGGGGGRVQVNEIKESVYNSALAMMNKLRCHALFKIFSQSDYLIQVFDVNSHTECFLEAS